MVVIRELRRAVFITAAVMMSGTMLAACSSTSSTTTQVPVAQAQPAPPPPAPAPAPPRVRG